MLEDFHVVRATHKYKNFKYKLQYNKIMLIILLSIMLVASMAMNELCYKNLSVSNASLVSSNITGGYIIQLRNLSKSIGIEQKDNETITEAFANYLINHKLIVNDTNSRLRMVTTTIPRNMTTENIKEIFCQCKAPISVEVQSVKKIIKENPNVLEVKQAHKPGVTS